MPAYIIAILNKTTDAAELAEYKRVAPAARTPGLRALAAYGTMKVLEGDPAEGAVILEFPSMEEAQAWYDAPAYQAVREHRLAGGDYRMMIVNGVG